MPTRPTRLADFMPYRLSIASNAVSDLIAGEYRSRFGLKIPEWRVMAVLGDAGGLTQRQLVNSTMMDKVAVNRACKCLEARELLIRSPNDQDGRSHHLELTVAGFELFNQIMPTALAMEKRVFACLDKGEVAALRASLDKLRACAAEIVGQGE